MTSKPEPQTTEPDLVLLDRQIADAQTHLDHLDAECRATAIAAQVAMYRRQKGTKALRSLEAKRNRRLRKVVS